MAQDTAIVDQLLSNLSRATVPEGYIADKILTPATTVQFSGKIGYYGKEHLRINTTLKGGEGVYNEIEVSSTNTDSYELTEHGLKKSLFRKDRANYQEPFDAEKDFTLFLNTKMKLAREKGVADVITSTSIITNNTTLSGSDQFDDATGGDPLGVADDAQESISTKTGMDANLLVLGKKVARTLLKHPQIMDRLGYKYNRTRKLSLQDIADAFEVEEVLVGTAIYDSSKSGQTSSVTRVWGNDMVFIRRSKVATKMDTTLGYHLGLVGQDSTGNGGGDITIYKTEKDEPPQTTLIQAESIYQDLIVDTDSAYLVKDAVS